MTNPRIDVAALAVGLTAMGFAVVLLAGQISASLVQPILAVILAAAGTIGLIASRSRSYRKEQS